MKKKHLPILIFAILGLALLVFFFVNRDTGKHYQWNTNYRGANNQPYGTLFLRNLLEGYKGGNFTYNDKTPLHQLLKRDSLNTGLDYVCVGEAVYLNDKDAFALMNHIYKGNDAFIAVEALPESIVDRIYATPECNVEVAFYTNAELKETLNFYHDTIRTEKGYTYTYRYGAKELPYSWTAINSGIFCDSTKKIAAIGHYNSNRINFISISYGQGRLFIHSAPIVFTNYFLSQEDKMEYVSAVFSHLKGKDVIWDEFSKIPYDASTEDRSNPLYYILEQPSLKYAWWMLLVTVLLYVLFTAKRTQRVIPVLEGKTNTSLEFVKMISALHFQNGKHADIARKKMKYFLYFIRSKYGLHANSFTSDLIQKLSDKSKVSLGEVESIFRQYEIIEQSSFQIEDKLTDLYYAIDNFYKKCK